MEREGDDEKGEREERSLCPFLCGCPRALHILSPRPPPRALESGSCSSSRKISLDWLTKQ